MSTEKIVEVLAEDTDILIMLIHHSPTAPNTLYFTTKTGVYNVMRIWQKLTDLEKERLLFIHAVTGCDTVSASFGQGKVKLYRKLGNAVNLGTVFENLLIICWTMIMETSFIMVSSYLSIFLVTCQNL